MEIFTQSISGHWVFEKHTTTGGLETAFILKQNTPEPIVITKMTITSTLLFPWNFMGLPQFAITVLTYESPENNS